MIAALGLDLGEKRIGVAGCDRLGLFASGITTIHRRSFAQDMGILTEIIAEREVELLVIGLPYTLEGTLGYQARRTQKLATRIAQAVHLPVEYIDERFTSSEAEALLRAQRYRPSEQRGLVDRTAAALILQTWLDQHRSQPPSHNRRN